MGFNLALEVDLPVVLSRLERDFEVVSVGLFSVANPSEESSGNCW